MIGRTCALWLGLALHQRRNAPGVKEVSSAPLAFTLRH
jgi:hypothetical protein